MSPQLSPGRLAARLALLPVHVEGVSVETRDVHLPDYPGEPRPSGIVTLSGNGHAGRGENVAFTSSEQQHFVSVAARWFDDLVRDQQQEQVVGSARERLVGSPYERAALEAALVDLALRQAGLTLSELTGVTESRLRYVVSLAATADPIAEIARHRGRGFAGDFKVDVEPTWPERVWRALGDDRSVIILDFKRRGDAALARVAEATIPHALFEDLPPDVDSTPALTVRMSCDAELLDLPAVEAALARSAAVNLKAPRMAGPLTVLNALELASQAQGLPLAYLGGMFEIDVGRSQAWQLAALYCPHAPNDLAPNRTVSGGDPRVVPSPPMTVRFDAPGFG